VPANDDNDNAKFGACVAAGEFVDHYRIFGKIGAERMGKVHLTEDLQFSRQAALAFLERKARRCSD